MVMFNKNSKLFKMVVVCLWFCYLKCHKAGEMAQWLKAHSTFEKSLNSVASTPVGGSQLPATTAPHGSAALVPQGQHTHTLVEVCQ